MSEQSKSFVQKFFQNIFTGLKLDKMIAQKVLNDPQVKAQISNLNRSTQIVINNAQRWKKLADSDD